MPINIPVVYAKHFGLRQEPFSIAPDPRYLFMTERHREALAHLLYGLQGSGGVVLLTGEIGAGKTTVARCFLEQVPRRCNVAYIFNPKLTVTELLRTICDEFGVPRGHISVATGSVKEYVDAINQYLLRTHAVGQNNVLVIDEAQNLSADVLEQLRLLTNLETAERKLLQIILIGQPELRDLLAEPKLEQLAQRITARYHLTSLNERETTQYIRHRMQVAGRQGSLPFDRPSRRVLYELSRGVPRRINLLCDRALLGAYARGSQRVSSAMVEHAAVEVFGPEAVLRGVSAFKRDPVAWIKRQLHALRPHQATIGAGALAGCLVLGLGLWGGQAFIGAQARKSSATASSSTTAASVATPSTSAQGLPALAANASPIRVLRDEAQALRLLALTAKITLDDGDPCVVAGKQRLSCDRQRDGNLVWLRGLKQPALLVLRDDQGQSGYVVYTGQADERAVLLRGEGGEVIRLDLVWLATQWRGEYAVFAPASQTPVGSSNGAKVATTDTKAIQP